MGEHFICVWPQVPWVSWYSCCLAWSMLLGSLRSAIGIIGPPIMNTIVVSLISILVVQVNWWLLRVIIMQLSIIIMFWIVSL